MLRSSENCRWTPLASGAGDGPISSPSSVGALPSAGEKLFELPPNPPGPKSSPSSVGPLYRRIGSTEAVGVTLAVDDADGNGDCDWLSKEGGECDWLSKEGGDCDWLSKEVDAVQGSRWTRERRRDLLVAMGGAILNAHKKKKK